MHEYRQYLYRKKWTCALTTSHCIMTNVVNQPYFLNQNNNHISLKLYNGSSATHMHQSPWWYDLTKRAAIFAPLVTLTSRRTRSAKACIGSLPFFLLLRWSWSAKYEYCLLCWRTYDLWTGECQRKYECSVLFLQHTEYVKDSKQNSKWVCQEFGLDGSVKKCGALYIQIKSPHVVLFS
jgi:hypothetical protein